MAEFYSGRSITWIAVLAGIVLVAYPVFVGKEVYVQYQDNKIHDEINSELDKTKQKRSLATVTSKDISDFHFILGLSSEDLADGGNTAKVEESFYGKVSVGEKVCVAYRDNGENARIDAVADKGACKR